MTEPTPEAAEAFFAALGSDHPLSTLRDEMVAAVGGAVQPLPSSPEPLTDQQIDEWTQTIATYDICGWRLTGGVQIRRFARAIEAEVRALAAPPSSPPEPLTDEQIDELIPPAQEMGVVFDSVGRSLQCYGFNIGQMQTLARRVAALAATEDEVLLKHTRLAEQFDASHPTEPIETRSFTTPATGTSLAMFIARLENKGEEALWTTREVLGLLNDCDMLAARDQEKS